MNASNAPVLITVTGHDHPGITARLTQVVAEEGGQLLDIEQVVVRGRLTLSLLVSLSGSRHVLKELLFAAKGLGVELDFEPLEEIAPRTVPVQRHVVTAIGPSLGAAEVHQISTALATHGGNIERISRLSEGPLASLEITLGLPSTENAARLKKELLSLAMASTFDVALQREGIYRRSKRLVVMDMDSTLIQIEVIDELARAHGVMAEVAKLTERAMQGEMDFNEALKQRLALLKGMEVSVLQKIASALPLTEGAETLIRVLKRLGYRTAVLSGGFSVAAEALQARLGIDYAYSNELEVVDGRLTGKVLGPIVNAQRKAELLETIARSEGILLDQVIAVGDGANDLLMLQAAGLGIAFRAKPRLREAADTSLSRSGLDAILYLLGISQREIVEAGL